ncbi:MAG TPA: hypothetical protein VL244_03050, partial [Alphaproteobacteria bacterium]|nr:hypothetical protein [Alphaproteobacteria bacterium]
MSASRDSRPAAGRLPALLLAAALTTLAGGRSALSQITPVEVVPLPPLQSTPGQPNEGGTQGTGTPAPAEASTPAATPAPAAAPAPIATPPAAPAVGGTPPLSPTVLVPPAEQPASAKAIGAGKLSASDREARAVPEARAHDLGADLWRGTPSALAVKLIAALPAGNTSPTLRALTERLLLAAATPPEGAEAGSDDFLLARAQKLAEMGDFEGLRALLATASGRAAASEGTAASGGDGDDALARVGIEARLIDGKTSEVCAEMAGLIRSYHSLFWQKLQVFCQALAKKSREVDLGVGLLREEGDDKDSAYFTLIDAIMGDKVVPLASLGEATPLMLAMMRAAKQPLPEDALRNAQPAVLRAIAESPDEGSDLCLAAAEHAALLGAFSGAELRRIYDGVTLSEAELQNALSQAQSDYGPRARALLYRAAQAQTVPAARAEALRAALALARSANVYQLAIMVNLPFIEELAPAPELGFFASEAGRALLYAGAIERAEDWFALADAVHPSAGTALEPATELWPYARLLASDSEPSDAEHFRAWRAGERAAAGAAVGLVDERAARLLGLTAALGKPLAGVAWQPLSLASDAEPAAMPSLPLWQGLSDAVETGRRGEAVLMVLIALGPGGAQNSNPIALDKAIESLRRLGLNKDARGLAIEAAV